MVAWRSVKRPSCTTVVTISDGPSAASCPGSVIFHGRFPYAAGLTPPAASRSRSTAPMSAAPPADLDDAILRGEPYLAAWPQVVVDIGHWHRPQQAAAAGLPLPGQYPCGGPVPGSRVGCRVGWAQRIPYYHGLAGLAEHLLRDGGCWCHRLGDHEPHRAGQAVLGGE